VLETKPENMRKIVLVSSVIALLLVIHACSKDSSNNGNGTTPPPSDARTVANLSGVYGLTALTATALGTTFNLYDSLPPCQRDDSVQLNSDLTVKFIDAGVACVPPNDSTGVWHISSNTDTIYVAGGSSVVKSFDGKTLVLLTPTEYNGFAVVATSTFVRK
jgi:hypothetical protein